MDGSVERKTSSEAAPPELEGRKGYSTSDSVPRSRIPKERFNSKRVSSVKLSARPP